MPRFAWNTGFGLALMGLGLTGCYAHHTADETVETPELTGDGDSTVVDPCADVADDDVAGQMACDPDVVTPSNPGGSPSGTGSPVAAGGLLGGTTSAACASATDTISQLVCMFGSTGGTGGTGGTSAVGGGTGQIGGGTSAADLIGLLGTLTGGGTQTGGTQTGGIDINTLIGLLGTLNGGTQTGSGGLIGGLTGGTATGGFIGGQTTTGGFIGGQTTTGGFIGGQTTGQNTALFGGVGGTGGNTGLFGGGGR